MEAISGDGRHVKYTCREFGDLVNVELPDASEHGYEYKHDTQSVTNDGKTKIEPCSLRLLTTESNPDGRQVFNVYNSKPRVTIQAATVVADLNLVTNATVSNQRFAAFATRLTGMP